jgi:hypothetical protein
MITDLNLDKLLSHPLLLLVVGALISRYLIPSLTRRWQDHQKKLELKIDLLNRIGESVNGIVTAIQFAECRVGNPMKEELDHAYRDWEISRAGIGASLRAYFPGSRIGHDWDSYSDLVTDFYSLTEIQDEKNRKDYLRDIRHRLTGSPDGIDWENLSKKKAALQSLHLRPQEHREYLSNWFRLKKAILSQKDDLVQCILTSRISAF